MISNTLYSKHPSFLSPPIPIPSCARKLSAKASSAHGRSVERRHLRTVRTRAQDVVLTDVKIAANLLGNGALTRRREEMDHFLRGYPIRSFILTPTPPPKGANRRLPTSFESRPCVGLPCSIAIGNSGHRRGADIQTHAGIISPLEVGDEGWLDRLWELGI